MRNQSKEGSLEAMGSGPGQGDGEGARLQGTVILVKVLVGLWCRWKDMLPF